MKLFKHQQESHKLLKKTPIFFDMSEPGTGKTGVEIVAFDARNTGKSALVIATKSILETAWQDDIVKFAPHRTSIVAYATNREKAFTADVDFYITNHDAVNWLVKQKPVFFKRFDTIIIDESTAFKHHTSKRSKALAKIMKYFKYRSCMSGTPMSNGVTDLWHQVYLLDEGARLGNSFFKFRMAACMPVQVGPRPEHIKWTDRDGINEVVSELLKDISIRHKLQECVDIPDNYRYSVNYHLSKAHMSQYQDMESQQLLLVKDKVINAVNGAALYTKLLQIASGAVYDNNVEYAVIDTGRYEMVLDLVEEREHSIVFFNWKHQKELLLIEAEKRGLSFAVIDGETKNRSEIARDFQAGKYRVIFAYPQSAGHGFTLTKGTATIWASPTYNLEHFLQGLRRVFRISQTQKTETIVVIATGTYDEKAWAILNSKDAKQSDFLEQIA